MRSGETDTMEAAMKLFVSLCNENFRRIFLTFYFLSCLLPVLIMLMVVYQHAVPILHPRQLDALSGMFTASTTAIVLIQAIGFFLLWWWTQSLEQFTRKMTHISRECLGDCSGVAEAAGSELIRLNSLFEGLYGELQLRMKQANETTRNMEALTQKMTTLACTDDLTRLFNRRHFRQKFTEMARQAERIGHSSWLVRFEIDNFSLLGDKDADHLLKEVGEIIRRTLPEKALPFRIGRNEFAILISDVDGRIAARITHNLTSAIAAYPFRDKSGQTMGQIGISCGIAGHKTDQRTMFSDAGRALINAQRMGQPIGVAPAA
jgi:diguanylate cyclase (GGDEF)-like protein